MSDTFKLPVGNNYNDIYEDIKLIPSSFGNFDTETQALYSAYAINNHDKLVECIEELIRDAQYAEDDECSTLFKAQALLAEIKGG